MDLFLILLIIASGPLAYWFGTDSRDGSGWTGSHDEGWGRR